MSQRRASFLVPPPPSPVFRPVLLAGAAFVVWFGCTGTVIVPGGAAGGPTTGTGGVPTTSSPPWDNSGAPGPQQCVPTSCADQGFDCGMVPDGCYGMLDCGECAPCGGVDAGDVDGGDVDGGGPVGDGVDAGPACAVCGAKKPNVCGVVEQCFPTTCGALGFDCGLPPDGCGGMLDCGLCTPPQVCGGGGKLGVCG